jgi:hypothetical protein
MNKTIMPDIPTAKNFALFSLFVCRRAFEIAALAFASASAAALSTALPAIIQT